MSFVGYGQVDSAEDLQELIGHYTKQSPSYYFLRWAHRVSGMQTELPEEFPSPEGQVFNANMELRWKSRKAGYDVLLLSDTADTATATANGFTAISGDWEGIDRPAHHHDSNETQYPKGFGFGHGVESEHIKQRYFCDRNTATVHFVALTIASSS
ncbi:MAG: hypothetical protein F6K11_06280 [Leptolyngbya sp. SIO3F4]|nr:hypothetical protein [Leptolyngbya sp. SIO3F4]